MIRKKVKRTNALIIDLTGPDGNAYVLMGYARKFGNQLGWDKEQRDLVIKEMISSDYENLLQVFDRYFGDYVILER